MNIYKLQNNAYFEKLNVDAHCQNKLKFFFFVKYNTAKFIYFFELG